MYYLAFYQTCSAALGQAQWFSTVSAEYTHLKDLENAWALPSGTLHCKAPWVRCVATAMRRALETLRSLRNAPSWRGVPPCDKHGSRLVMAVAARMMEEPSGLTLFHFPRTLAVQDY